VKTVFGIVEKERKPNKKYVFVKVLAEYRDHQLIEVQEARLHYPSEGEVIWSPAPEDIHAGKVGFYTIEERNEEDYAGRLVYSKFIVRKELENLKYYEVFPIPFSLAQNHDIVYLIQNGFDAPQQFSSEILLLTNDDYLVGPYRVKQTKEQKWVIDSSDDKLLEIRKKGMHLVKYNDKNVGIERYFVSAMLASPVEDYLDCATNDRIMRYALKTLKDQQQVQEISRKVISQLSELVSDLPPQVRYERIMRAIELLAKYQITKEDIGQFEEELLQYPAIQRKIEDKLEERFAAEKARIEDEHRKVLNETEQLRRKKEHLLVEMEEIERQIKETEERLKKADEALELKIKEMKDNIFRTLADLLPFANLGLNVSTHNESNDRNHSQWVVKDVDETTVYYEDINHLMTSIAENLCMIGMQENKAWLTAKTIIGAILFRKPVVVKGEFSFELSQAIGWAVAGNDHLTVFPDIKNFTNKTLINCFSRYTRPDCVKSLHLCQIENSPAELYLQSFLDYWRVSIDESLPELILISIKEESELTDSFIQKLSFSPVISADEMTTTPDILSLRKTHRLVFGSIPAHLLVEGKILKEKSSEFNNFLEIVQEVMSFTKQKEAFKKWFRLLEDERLEEEAVSVWVVKVLLQPYVAREQAKKILEEFDSENILI
jgi:hypothetical protein